MSDGIASALAGLIAATTVVLLMAGTHFFGPSSRSKREFDDEDEDEDYRRYRRWLREQRGERDE